MFYSRVIIIIIITVGVAFLMCNCPQLNNSFVSFTRREVYGGHSRKNDTICRLVMRPMICITPRRATAVITETRVINPTAAGCF